MSFSERSMAGHKRKRTNDIQFTATIVNRPLTEHRNGIAKRRRVGSKDESLKRSKKPHPPRPAQPLTFELPKRLFTSASSTSTPTGTLSPLPISKAKGERSRSSTPTQQQSSSMVETPLIRLARINILLSAIHRRNKNQHRNQPFYKHFSILRRCISKLINLYNKSAALSEPSTARPGIQQPTSMAALARERFEKESQLRSQRESLEEHVRETIVPGAYVTFSALVADTQFANLGVVLLGLLVDVVGVVGSMRKIEERKNLGSNKGSTNDMDNISGGFAKRLVGLSTVMTGPDKGKIVERVYDSDNGVLSEMEVDAEKQNPDRGQDDGNDIDMGEVIQRGQLDTVSQARGRRVADQGLHNMELHPEDDDHGEEESVVSRAGEAEANTKDILSMSFEQGPASTMSSPTRIPASQPMTTLDNDDDDESSPPTAQTHTQVSSTYSPRTPTAHRSPTTAKPKTMNPTQLDTTLNASTQLTSIRPVSRDDKTIKAKEARKPAKVDERASADGKRKEPRSGKEKVKTKKKNAIDDLFSGFG